MSEEDKVPQWQRDVDEVLARVLGGAAPAQIQSAEELAQKFLAADQQLRSQYIAGALQGLLRTSPVRPDIGGFLLGVEVAGRDPHYADTLVGILLGLHLDPAKIATQQSSVLRQLFPV